ncbi:MAG: ribosome-associated translation inhibitor RaiA [Clostridia bacterium]|nr:ribosome-associated translation inhibitor RaiA [Clostridia bacterium]
MKIDILERNYKAKDKLKDILAKKLARFEKYLDDNASAKVVLSEIKGDYKLEITVASKGMFVRSEVVSDNMYANIDLCLAKLERQIVKYSEKFVARRRKIEPELLMFFDEVPAFEKPKITRRKKYDLEPMTEEQAIEQLELVDNDFYVFLNKKTQTVCVLYRRHNSQSEYGIIETNA